MKAVNPLVTTVKLQDGIISIFGKLAGRSGSFFLDSGSHLSLSSRYSFAGIDPIHTFSSEGGFITIDGRTTIDDPVSALQNFLKQIEELPFHDNYLPFAGGAIGFIGHEWANSRGAAAYDTSKVPDVAFGVYDTILTFDHLENIAWITSFGLAHDGSSNENLARSRTETLIELINGSGTDSLARRHYPPTYGRHEMVSSIDKDSFIGGAMTWKKLGRMPLFARQFASPTHKSSWQTYIDLRRDNPSSFGGFINLGASQILSSSRTCILKIDGQKISSEPAKGSAPAAANTNQNSANISELKFGDEVQSTHRRMVADIMLGLDKISQYGTIEAVKVAEVESDHKAHHLVSKISATRAQNASPLDCLLQILPAATDAHTANVRRSLERVSRSVYTGTIGFVGFGKRSEFNLAYRTLIFKDAVGYLHSGAEIKRTTDPEEAFYQTSSSAKRIFDIIQT